MDNFFTRYKIEDRSYVSFIKREIHTKIVAAGFDQVKVGQIDIVVSELTSNLVKHAGAGELLYRIRDKTGTERPFFEVLCIDKGPGIDDMKSAMKDGMSTTMTLGQGLGAMQRLSNIFQIVSMPKWGTVLYSRFGERENTDERKPGSTLDITAVCVPKPHEEVCGDGWAVRRTESYTKILFGDGLGHGPHAQEAVDAASEAFMESEETDPVAILREINAKVKRTRGLVATVAVFDRKALTWSICGIGNISVRLYTGIEYRNYMSYNGTVGLNIPNSMNATHLKVERNQHLFFCSDGILTRWDITKVPAMFKYDLALMAATLYKDFSRGTDDSSILIAKVI
jgi:anti-sigma regulatory factor (Ser/Thr protein kinase)